MSYQMETDGVDHINANCVGRTLLGMMLYKGAYSPMEHPSDGRFISMTGYWGWLITGEYQDTYRYLYGENLYQYLRTADIRPGSHIHKRLHDAMVLKINQNLTLRSLFVRNSSLPYVIYGDINHEPFHGEDDWSFDDAWMIKCLTELQKQYAY